MFTTTGKKNKSDTYPGVGPPSPRLNTCLGLSKYWNLCSNLFIENKKSKKKNNLRQVKTLVGVSEKKRVRTSHD